MKRNQQPHPHLPEIKVLSTRVPAHIPLNELTHFVGIFPIKLRANPQKSARLKLKRKLKLSSLSSFWKDTRNAHNFFFTIRYIGTVYYKCEEKKDDSIIGHRCRVYMTQIF